MPGNAGAVDLAASPLFGAVLADPDDDAARLVLADRLLEEGDPRGELIQIQCALAGVVGASLDALRRRSAPQELTLVAHDELSAREEALLRKHQAAWLAPIRPFVRTWTWERGFVQRVVADAQAFLAGVEVLFATTPLTHATWTAIDETRLAALGRALPSRRLRSLTVAQQRIGPREASAFSSAGFEGLRRLDAWGNPLGDEGVAVLAGAAPLGALEELKLATCRLTIAGVDALSRASFFPKLQELDLAYNSGLGPALGAVLTRGSSLRTLSLVDAGIGDAGLEALAGSPSMRHLTTLHLAGNRVGPRGALALAASPHLGALTTVTGLVGYAGGLKPSSAEAMALKERFGAGLR